MSAAANRFALFADAKEPRSPAEAPAPKANPFANQVADNDNPWEQVKRGGPAQKTIMKTLVIRNPNAPVVRSQPRQTRNFTETTQDSDSSKSADPYECWCGVCRYKFPSKSALLMHIKQTSGHENYCNLCKRIFVDRNGLKNHVDNASGHDVFCNICLSAFVNDWGLRNHFENNRSAPGHEFTCLTCLMGFKNPTDLEQHLASARKHVWCGTCHRKFHNQDERDEHWAKTTRHKHCLQPGCDFDAPNQSVLEKHLSEDHFQCDGCKRVFPSQNKLNQHGESCQSDVNCPNCGYKCAGQLKLGLHLVTCYYCAECDFRAKTEGLYQLHMTKHATAAIPCWRCDASVRKHSTLIAHFETRNCPHLPDPTLLLHCIGSFWHSCLYMDVDMHVQIRSGRIDLNETIDWMKAGTIHPFVCRANGCGRSFAQFSSLLLHVESQACAWDVETLRLDLLKAEFERMCARRDSATAVMG